MVAGVADDDDSDNRIEGSDEEEKISQLLKLVGVDVNQDNNASSTSTTTTTETTLSINASTVTPNGVDSTATTINKG